MADRLPRNHGVRISADWTYLGMRTIVIENELLRVTVLPEKGSDIVEFRYKPLDLDFLLATPGGMRRAEAYPPSAPTPTAFLDYYSGGWNEILPSGGVGASYQGAVLGQHGESSLIAWEYTFLLDAPEGVAVRLWARLLRTPLFIEKTLSLKPGRAVLEISETLTNEGGEPVHLMWGHHIAFGRPFLDEGATIQIPAQRIFSQAADYLDGSGQCLPRRFRPGAVGAWPSIPATDGSPADASQVPPFGALQAAEMAYVTGLQEGRFTITNPVKKVAFELQFDPALFHYIWYWQELGNVSHGYPWWGRLHAAALEPWTSYGDGGLNEAIANGSALLLQPGEQRSTHLSASAYQDG